VSLGLGLENSCLDHALGVLCFFRWGGGLERAPTTVTAEVCSLYSGSPGGVSQEVEEHNTPPG